MTFPQPPSTEAILNGQNFFRLKTQLAGAGDIYESENSGHAIALGPDSDIAIVNVFYYDELTRFDFPSILDPSKVSSVQISPERPFTGRLNARMDTVYPLTGQPARILIAPADLFVPFYLPPGFSVMQDAIAYEPVFLDIIQYFVELPSLYPNRGDKTYRYVYAYPTLAAGGSSFILIPSYGRKSGFFTFKNLDPALAVTVRVFGLKFSTSNPPGPAGTQQTQIFTSVIAVSGTDVFPFNSSISGIWDMMLIELENYDAGPMPMTVLLSDRAL